jgi:hypothetical protein
VQPLKSSNLLSSAMLARHDAGLIVVMDRPGVAPSLIRSLIWRPAGSGKSRPVVPVRLVGSISRTPRRPLAGSAARTQLGSLNDDHSLSGGQTDVVCHGIVAEVAQERGSLTEVGVLRQRSRR